MKDEKINESLAAEKQCICAECMPSNWPDTNGWRCEKSRSLTAEAREASPWRGIESAPRDIDSYEQVRVLVKSGKQFITYWGASEDGDEGWVIDGFQLEGEMLPNGEVTHWMPTSSPTASEAREAGKVEVSSVDQACDVMSAASARINQLIERVNELYEENKALRLELKDKPVNGGLASISNQPTAAEVIAVAKKAMEMAHEILRKQGIDPGCYSPRNFDEQQVLHIAEHHGYGNLMVLLSSKWYQLQRGGAFSVGRCISSNASDAREINAAIKALAAWEAAQR